MNLSHVIMPRRLRMCARLHLAVDDLPAHLALDSHATCVGVVVLGLQHATQVLCADQDLVVVCVPHALVELGRTVRACVRRLRWALHDGVVVDARVHEDAARGPTLVEPVHSKGLRICKWMPCKTGWGNVLARRCYRSRCRSTARGCPSL